MGNKVVEVVRIGATPIKVVATTSTRIGSILTKAGITGLRHVKIKATVDGVTYTKIGIKSKIGKIKELLVIGNVKGAY